MENATQWFVIIYVMAEIILPIVFFIFMVVLAYYMVRQDQKKKEDKESDEKLMARTREILKRMNEHLLQHPEQKKTTDV